MKKMNITVPELAESINEGTIAEWLKEEGDAVEQGESVAILETDKVNIEVTAEASGVLKEIRKQVGDTVQVGETIAVLAEAGEEADMMKKAEDQKQEAKDPESEAKEKDVKPEEKTSEQTTSKQEDQVNEQADSNKTQQKAERVIASPAARKQAREKGIDLNEVSNRDPLGRVRLNDVISHATNDKVPKKPDRAVTESKAAAGPDSDRPTERVRMSRRRQTIAKRLVDVQHKTAMLTTFNEVDMTAILDVRKRRKDPFYEQHQVRLGFMSFFTKAVVGALKAFPMLNAEIQGDEILVKQYYDIGIAVAAEEGLVVPVIRNADRLSFAGIEKEIARLAEKARSNKLSLSELQGGTFTITNGGVFGSLFSTPILNAPQVGILGMHAIQKRPVAVDDQIEIRPMMYVALSYDHRIVDGSEAVSFLVKIKQMLEDPETLLLEG